MRILGVLIKMVLVVGCSNCFGQSAKLYPPLNEIKDLSLTTFLADLKTAVKKKDKDFILNNMSPDMMNGFGGDGGIEEFKEYYWKEDIDNFWMIMDHILTLGGGPYNGGGEYSVPYVYNHWPGHEEYDVFDHLAITGTEVNVRNKPSLEDSDIVDKLSYDIVKVDYEKSYPPFNGPRIEHVNYIGSKLWYYIETSDGSKKGYVFWKYVWSAVDYRLGFLKDNNKWMICFLVAGD